MSSPVWEYFIKGTKKYKNNQSNWEAWCSGCINHKVSVIRARELDAQIGGVPARSEDIIRASLISSEDPMCGKVDEMWLHLSKCANVADSIRQAGQADVKERKAKKKARYNKENISPSQLQSPLNANQSFSRVPSFYNTPARQESFSSLDTDSAPPLFQLEDSPIQRNSFNQGENVFSGVFVAPTRQWTPEDQAQFNSDLCRLLIACNIAWRAVEHPFWRHFFLKWMPECAMPGRAEVSGRILSEEAGKVVDQMAGQVGGQYATGMCDGWKNVKKASLVTSMINVKYKPFMLNVYDVSALPKTGETLLTFVLGEIIYISNVLKAWVIAWCTDAGGDAAKMRRLLRKEIPRLICIDCWAHQINLVVGDFFKLKNFMIGIIDNALEVVKWFNNHSRALGLLRTVQLEKEGKILALILPVLTRWTSHYLAIRRLLELEKSFKRLLLDHGEALLTAAGKKADQMTKAKSIIDILEGVNFWNNLRQVQLYLEPLAVAANATQSDSARLDVVLMTLANLFWIFSNPSLSIDQLARNTILGSLERRWRQADRDVFLLAVVLNPCLRVSYFPSNSPLRCFNELWQIIQRVYMRVFATQVPPDDKFRTSFREYLRREGRWSDSALDLSHHRELAEEKKAPINVLSIWEDQEVIGDGVEADRAGDFSGTTPPRGSIGLVRLALIIFSVVPNSAAVERVFSQFGIVHSKLRNRLHPEKVRKTVLVRYDIENRFPASSNRKKRKFDTLKDLDSDDNDDEDLTQSAATNTSVTVSATPVTHRENLATTSPSESSSQASNTLETDPSFATAAQEMIAEATEAEAAEVADSNLPTQPASSSSNSAKPIPEPFSLANLFQYPSYNSSEGHSLQEYWQYGKNGLAAEVSYHEQVHSSSSSVN